MKVVQWLARFQKQTESSKIKITSLEDNTEMLISRYTDFYPNTKKEKTFFKEHVVSKIREEGSVEIQLGAAHGDFSPANILKEENKIKVIDWEDMRKNAFPTDDLFNYFLQVRFDNVLAKTAAMDSFKFVFTEKNWFSRIVEKCFDWYCTERDIDRGLLKIFFPIYLLERVIWEKSGEDKKTGKTPKKWDERLQFYVNNSADFDGLLS